jgi:hypothetical protein
VFERLLFQKLPVSLFVPLAAPLAELYAAALLRIFEETQRHQEPLSWEYCVSQIVETIVESETATQDHIDLSMEVEMLLPVQEPPPVHTLNGTSVDGVYLAEDREQSLRERATELLRNLKQYQWLREEIQADGTLMYSLPEHAFRLLRVFHEIATGHEERLQGVICNIHDLLQAAVREGNASVRVPQARDETRRLLSRLKELQHTIGLHIEQILQQRELKDVLEQTFVIYLRQVSRSSYHELRTTDHVSRFRGAIYQAIHLLQTRFQHPQEALREILSPQRLLDDLEEIHEQFDQLENLLQAIDLRHSQFFDAAVRAIQLKLSAGTRTSGHLFTILQHVMEAPDDEQQPINLAQLITLHSLELLDERSLMAPRKVSETFTAPLDESPPPSEEELAKARLATLEHLRRAISHERIRQFAAEILGDCQQRRAGELKFNGPDDLPMLIYLRQYGRNGALGYRSVEIPDAPWIEQAGIGFRDFLIQRVEQG